MALARPPGGRRSAARRFNPAPGAPRGPRSSQDGEYAVRWNGRSDRGDKLRSGLYFYRITAGNFVWSRKLIVR